MEALAQDGILGMYENSVTFMFWLCDVSESHSVHLCAVGSEWYPLQAVVRIK